MYKKLRRTMKTFTELDQGDQVTILELARNAIDHQSILDAMDISDDYAQELNEILTVMTDEMTDA